MDSHRDSVCDNMAIIIWEIYTSPIMPDDYDNKEIKKDLKRKRSHGKLGGNLEDVHMRDDR